MVDLVEDVVEVCRDGGKLGLHEVDEDVDGVGIDACPFVSVGVGDGVADVAGESILLCGGGRGWVVLGGDGFCVEFVDIADVGAVDRCHGGGCAGPANSSAVLVRIRCFLGCAVVALEGRCGGLGKAGACHGGFEEVPDVAGVDGIDAIGNCFVDGFVEALTGSGWR